MKNKVSFLRHLRQNGILFREDAQVPSTLRHAPAELLIRPTVAQLPTLIQLLVREEVPYAILGGGSDTLLMGTDKQPLKTPIILTSRMREVSLDGNGLAIAEAGAKICAVSRIAAEGGFANLEFARDIPGSVAGAVVTDAWHPIHNYQDLFMDAGIDDISGVRKFIRDILSYVEVMDKLGNISSLPTAELQMENRRSIFTKVGNDKIILKAVFQLEKSDPQRILKIMDVVRRGRARMREKNKQLNQYSVGNTLGYAFTVSDPQYGGCTAMDLIQRTHECPPTLADGGMLHSLQTPNIVCNT